MNTAGVAAGAALAGLFAYKSKFPATLFSYHPTLLGLGWLALAPLAVKYLRESKDTTDKKVKESKVQNHAYLNIVCQVATYGGCYAIWRNKELMAAAKKTVAQHLASTHGKLGALTTSLLLASGLVASYETLFKPKYGINYLWRNKIHRWLGILSYLCSGLTILSIVNAPWGKFNLGGPNGQKLVSMLVVAIQAAVIAPSLGLAK